jgi:hypothetical protein
MLRLDRGASQQVSQTTAQQGRPQDTVLRFDRQVVNADYDSRVQDEYLTQKYDLRTWSLLSYKIEPILKKRKKGRRVQYLVKWLEYQESFNSWIFKQDLQKRSARRGVGLVLIGMSTVLIKYVVNQKLKHFDDIIFREPFGRIRVLFFT